MHNLQPTDEFQCFEVRHDDGANLFTNGHEACAFASEKSLRGAPARSTEISISYRDAHARGLNEAMAMHYGRRPV